MAATSILNIKILGDAQDALKALQETDKSVSGFQEGIKKAAVPAAAALGGLAAAGAAAASAAAEDQAAQDQLAVALRNSAGASDASIAATEDWISKTSKAAAVADDELRPALGTLVRATGDVGEAQDLMGVALDVSAATGKDLGSVSDALSKAYSGQTTALNRLLPGLDSAIVASGDMDAITAELARTTGGAATEAANSAAGQWEGMKIAMDETKESIGGALLPIMEKLAQILSGVAEWVQKNTTLFLVIAGVVGTFATAILILNAAMKVHAIVSKVSEMATKKQTLAQLKLNLAFLMSPITWIILGVMALVAAIILIATKTTWFSDLWTAVWGWISETASTVWQAIVSVSTAAIDWIVGLWNSLSAAVGAVWDWIKNAVDTALDFIRNAIERYINFYIAIWDGLVAAVTAVWNWIQNAIDTVLGIIRGIIQKYIDIYVRIFESIKDAVGAVWDWLKDAATTALDAILVPVNAVKDAFDKVVDAIRSVIDWLGKIKMPEALSNIASTIGGLFSVTPPPSSAGTLPATAGTAPRMSVAASSAHRSGGNGGTTITINGALDPVAVARQLRQILLNDQRRHTGVILR